MEEVPGGGFSGLETTLTAEDQLRAKQEDEVVSPAGVRQRASDAVSAVHSAKADDGRKSAAIASPPVQATSPALGAASPPPAATSGSIGAALEGAVSSKAGNQSRTSASNAPASASTQHGSHEFMYPEFLQKFKHPSAQGVVNQVRDFVMDFPPNLPRTEAARRIHDFVTVAAPQLAASEAFACGSGGADAAGGYVGPGAASDPRMEAAEGLEKFVVLKLYKVLFRHSPADVREDDRLERCLRESSGSIVAQFLKDLPADLSEQFDAAALELRKIDQYRAPRDKVVVLLNAYRFASSAVEDDEASMTRALAALLVQAAPPNLFSNLEFASAFRHPARRTNEDKRCLRAFALAVSSVSGGAVADLPPWLVDAGVTFRFEGREAGDITVGEVDELFDEYRRMLQVLRDLCHGDQQVEQ